MAAAEGEAVLRGCSFMGLDTHSFQAPAFYQRLGFEIFGSHTDYLRGHFKHYLRKTLKKYRFRPTPRGKSILEPRQAASLQHQCARCRRLR
jgi:hypothetical protein